MKKIFLALAATAAFATMNYATAQKASDNDVKLSIAFAAPVENNNSFTAASASTINLKALKDFQKSFKSATNASWYAASDGGFIASFKENDVQNSVAYDKKGNWVYNIKRYAEKDLPKDVRAEVKSTYYDFNITHVEEVLINDQTIYIVHMEDATQMKTLRVSDGEMQEIENLIKG